MKAWRDAASRQEWLARRGGVWQGLAVVRGSLAAVAATMGAASVLETGGTGKRRACRLAASRQQHQLREAALWRDKRASPIVV